jgi:hypothetical protein
MEGKEKGLGRVRNRKREGEEKEGAGKDEGGRG